MSSNESNSEYSYFYRYCIKAKKKNEKLIGYFVSLLKENSFKIKEYTEKDEIIILLGQTSEEKILQVAENSKIRKKYTKRSSTEDISDITLPEIVIEHEMKRNFRVSDRNNYVSDSNYDELHNNKKNDENWGFGIFTESEMLSLNYKLLTSIEVNESAFLSLIPGSTIEKKLEDIKKTLKNEHSLFHILSNFKVIKDHFPLHVSDFKEKIFKETSMSLRCPYRKIRNYFGDKVGIYYAWVYHYTRFLMIPAITSILITVLSGFFPKSSKSLYTAYAVIIAIWSQLFIIYWDRKCGEISIEWDNFTEEYDKENVRREFKGEWKKSPITDLYEKYYPNSKRKLSYVISFLISLPFLLFALVVNICFLNLSGFIKPHLNSILEIEFLAKFSEEGRIFEVGGLLNGLIGIIQVITVQFINKAYRNVAKKTCDMENHRLKNNYENSLIIKRFIFEFFDTFISLFYLAFVIHDINAVKSSLQGLFIANEIRRVVTETIIPNLINLANGSSITKIFSKGDRDLMKLDKEINLKDVLVQSRNEEYDTFDDYLEIVLEFGYLVLFAECFPLAPVFILIVNNIEIRSDILKLSTVMKRPKLIRKRNIGSWHLIFKLLTILSIFTNMLFTFTYSDTEFNNYIGGEIGASQLLKFFIMEHFVFIVIIVLRLCISNQAYWVTLFLARREYKMKNNTKFETLFKKNSLLSNSFKSDSINK